jgi:hypothetical protein
MKILFVEVHFVGPRFITMMNTRMYTSVEAEVSKTNVVMSLNPKRCEANVFSEREVSCLNLTAEDLEGENAVKGNCATHTLSKKSTAVSIEGNRLKGKD